MRVFLTLVDVAQSHATLLYRHEGGPEPADSLSSWVIETDKATCCTHLTAIFSLTKEGYPDAGCTTASGARDK